MDIECVIINMNFVQWCNIAEIYKVFYLLFNQEQNFYCQSTMYIQINLALTKSNLA